MAFELAAYGFVTGFLYSKLKGMRTKGVLISLTAAMIIGRIVWGIAKSVLLYLNNKQFLMEMFIAQGFVDAIPGIILQFILIPPIMYVIEKKEIKSENGLPHKSANPEIAEHLSNMCKPYGVVITTQKDGTLNCKW